MTRRIFLALDPDETLRKYAAVVAEDFRSLARVRLVAPEALHVTLRFFGDTNDAQLAALLALVTRFRGEIDLDATTLIAFPDSRRARVIGLGFADPRIDAIAADAERAAIALGFEPERRPFRAHLTLARLRAPADIRGRIAPPLPGGCRLQSVTLYASDFRRYTALAQQRL